MSLQISLISWPKAKNTRPSKLPVWKTGEGRGAASTLRPGTPTDWKRSRRSKDCNTIVGNICLFKAISGNSKAHSAERKDLNYNLYAPCAMLYASFSWRDRYCRIKTLQAKPIESNHLANRKFPFLNGRGHGFTSNKSTLNQGQSENPGRWTGFFTFKDQNVIEERCRC